MWLQKKPFETTATNNYAETTSTEKITFKPRFFFFCELRKMVRCGNFFYLLLYNGKLLDNVTIEKIIRDDEKFCSDRSLMVYRSMFRDELLPWLRHVTGLQLTDTIDMTCSKYNYTGKCFCDI